MSPGRRLSPASALKALGVGHTVWGLIAHHDQLRGIAQDLPGSVGDGIFDKAHSRDARAAAYWFLFAGPLVGLCGRLAESAEKSGDLEAQRSAGRIICAVSVAGEVVTPRSGFPAGFAIGAWMLRKAREDARR